MYQINRRHLLGSSAVLLPATETRKNDGGSFDFNAPGQERSIITH
jgi:hypothetical protein